MCDASPKRGIHLFRDERIGGAKVTKVKPVERTLSLKEALNLTLPRHSITLLALYQGVTLDT